MHSASRTRDPTVNRTTQHLNRESGPTKMSQKVTHRHTSESNHLRSHQRDGVRTSWSRHSGLALNSRGNPNLQILNSIVANQNIQKIPRSPLRSCSLNPFHVGRCVRTSGNRSAPWHPPRHVSDSRNLLRKVSAPSMSNEINGGAGEDYRYLPVVLSPPQPNEDGSRGRNRGETEEIS